MLWKQRVAGSKPVAPANIRPVSEEVAPDEDIAGKIWC